MFARQLKSLCTSLSNTSKIEVGHFSFTDEFFSRKYVVLYLWAFAHTKMNASRGVYDYSTVCKLYMPILLVCIVYNATVGEVLSNFFELNLNGRSKRLAISFTDVYFGVTLKVHLSFTDEFTDGSQSHFTSLHFTSKMALNPPISLANITP